MSKEIQRTYIPYNQWEKPSEQREYTKPTPLLNKDGTLNAKGWARKNVFIYDRSLVKRERFISRKEWDYYTVTDGKKQLLISFANVGIGGFAGCRLLDLETGEVSVDTNAIFIGGNTCVPLGRVDAPGIFRGKAGNAEFVFNTKATKRTIDFSCTHQGKALQCHLDMAIPAGLENMTTVLPFREGPHYFFMTTKQNCLATSGTLKFGDFTYEFSKDTSFCTLDWGKVNTPREMVWYWGSAATYLTDDKGKKHLFGWELTWAIGDESYATETCIFYDGKVHKIGAVDVESFPKGRFMEPWTIASEDGRLKISMTPTYDNRSDLNIKIARMNCHQLYGKWNGYVILDDGTKIEVKDLFGFCEYVENKW